MNVPAVTDERPTVFFHVMKCGGTSVRSGLAASATGSRQGSNVFELDGDAAKAAAAGTNVDNWVFRDALLPYVLVTMRPSIVLGHFRYRDRYLELLDSADFVTVLRDPVERIVSLYKYRRYREGVDIPVSFGFDEFIATPRWAKEGHLCVDTFCGRDDLDPRSDEAVAAAVANLRRFAVVGFIDRLDDFSSAVTSRLGKPVTIPMLNTSPAPADADIEPDALERARLVCAPDIALFEQTLAAS
jgi:hypothetical protein